MNLIDVNQRFATDVQGHKSWQKWTYGLLFRRSISAECD